MYLTFISFNCRFNLKERNRESAANSRKRKRELIETLEGRVKELENENRLLRCTTNTAATGIYINSFPDC